MRLLTAVATVLIAGTAFAQTTLVEIEDDNIIVQPMNVSVDTLEDMTVYDGAGARIGEVEEVLGTADALPTAVAVDADTFLGQEGDNVIIALDQINAADGKLVTTATKESLTSMPRWAD